MAHVTLHTRDLPRAAALFVAMTGALAMVAACGADTAKSGASGVTAEDTSSPAAGDESLPGWPSCSDVWVAESTLPQGYTGCVEGEVSIASDAQRCSSGQVIVTYDDRFYAVEGGPVNATDGLTDDSAFQQAITACLG